MKIIYTHKEAVDEALTELSHKYKELKRFCDLGCGSGERTILFCGKNRDIIGIDIKNYMSDFYKRFKFIEKDIFDSGLPDKSFDIILSFDVIEHMDNPNKILKEMKRLLKKNGIIILSTPNKYRLFSAPLVYFGIRKFPYCIDKEKKEIYPEFWHIKEYSSRDLKTLVINIGFKIISHFKIFYGISGKIGFKSLFGLPFFHNHILVLTKN